RLGFRHRGHRRRRRSAACGERYAGGGDRHEGNGGLHERTSLLGSSAAGFGAAGAGPAGAGVAGVGAPGRPGGGASRYMYVASVISARSTLLLAFRPISLSSATFTTRSSPATFSKNCPIWW